MHLRSSISLILIAMFGLTAGASHGADCATAQFKAAAPLCQRALNCEKQYVANPVARAAGVRATCLQRAATTFSSTFRKLAGKAPACRNGGDPNALATGWLTRISGTGGTVQDLLLGWDSTSVASNRLYAKLLAAAAPACGQTLKTKGGAAGARAKFARAAANAIRQAKRRGLNYQGAEPALLAGNFTTLAAAPVDPTVVVAGPIPPPVVPGPQPNPNPTPGQGPVPPLQNVNRGLTGTLRFSRPFEGGELDVATGIVTTSHPGTGSPSLDGTELIDSSLKPLSDDDYAADIRIFGRDGRTLVRFDVPEDRWRGPTLSPDYQRIVIGDLYNAYLYDRNGTELATLQNVDDWSWRPDGRLFVVRGDSLYVRSGPLLENEVLFKAFPGQKPGIPEVSPDGTRLVFQLGDSDAGVGWLFHVYTMNSDGSGLTQITHSNGIDQGSPAWSPDGLHIVFTSPSRNPGGSNPSPYSKVCPLVYAVPSNASNVAIQYGLDSEPAFLVKHYGKVFTDWRQESICAFSGVSWRASLPALPNGTGTVPGGSGLNAGLGGRLSYAQVGGDVLVDIASGSAAAAPYKEGYLTRDGTEAADLDFNKGQLNIVRLDGTPTNRIEDADLSSPVRFSPDGQKLALPWRPASDPVSRFNNVTVMLRNGTVVGRFYDYLSWDWMPDGRLVMARKTGGIDISDPGLTRVARLLDVKDRISDLKVSNDGGQIAFVLGGHIWRANGDGTGLRQLTVSGGEDRTPEFSPDGRYLAVRWKEDSDTICGEIWIVPSDGERVFIGNALVPSSAFRFRQMEGDHAAGVTCAQGILNWR